MKVLRVIDWDKHYENHRSRELINVMWIQIPNKFEDGYLSLVCRENGAAMLGAWIAFLQVASKCKPRGTLIRNKGMAHTAETIARMCSLPKKEIQSMLDVCLVDPKWIELIDLEDVKMSRNCAGSARESAGLARDQRGTVPKEWNRKEKKEKKEINTKSKAIYSLYPSVDPKSKRPTGKSESHLAIIDDILKEGKYPLEEGIRLYVDYCKQTDSHIWNFGRFLAELPDLEPFRKSVQDPPYIQCTEYLAVGTRILRCTLEKGHKGKHVPEATANTEKVES